MAGRLLRQWVVLVCCLAAMLASGAVMANDPSPGDEGEGGGRSGNQVDITAKFISVTTADARRLGIDWVVLADGETTLFADAGKGVSQEDQNRLDLSFIPILGQATGTRYTADDVAPETRVGSAWFLERILFVALDPARSDILSRPEIVVLNDKSAFVMNAPAVPIEWEGKPEFAAIANLSPFRDFAAANVKVPESGTILIGGLDAPGSTEAASRVPVLGTIPALGRLFAGSAHQGGRSQLVILIKPSIIAPE